MQVEYERESKERTMAAYVFLNGVNDLLCGGTQSSQGAVLLRIFDQTPVAVNEFKGTWSRTKDFNTITLMRQLTPFGVRKSGHETPQAAKVRFHEQVELCSICKNEHKSIETARLIIYQQLAR